MTRKFTVSVGLIALATGLLILSGDSAAQVKKGKTRPAATKCLMLGITQPNCAGLGKLLKDGPKDDKAWETAACHAACLNEMSHVLMQDGRCPDKTWADAAKTLGNCSADVMDKIAAKDSEGASAAFKDSTLLGRSWARLISSPNSVAAVASCCAASPSSTSAPSCCATGPKSELEDCCTPSAEANSGHLPRRRFPLRQVNQLLLGLTTVSCIRLLSPLVRVPPRQQQRRFRRQPGESPADRPEDRGDDRRVLRDDCGDRPAESSRCFRSHR